MSPDEFRSFANLLPEPMLLISGDGTVLAANGSCASRRFGIPEGGLVGRRISELAENDPQELAGYLKSCSRCREMLLGALSLNVGGKTREFRCEGAVVQPDADPSQRRLLLRLTPKNVSSSRFIALNQKLGELSAELVKRRRVEAELKEQWEWLRVTLASIGDAVVATDTNSQVTLINGIAELLTGWNREEAIGKPLGEIFRIINEGTRNPVENPVGQVLRDGRIVGLANHTLLISRNGTERAIDDSAAPIIDDRGNVVGVVLVFKDITARKLADEEHRIFEAKLQHAQKLESLGVLAGGIAHDFNNLLVAILGNASLILDDMSPVAPARAGVEQIETAAARAADLCRQLLAYSGKGQFVVRPFDLSKLVGELGHLLEVAISKNVVLKYDLDDELPAIEADVSRIQQVVMNLITNASEAIEKKSGIVNISTGVMDIDREYLSKTFFDDDLSEGSYVFLEVSDTGRGMDAETQKKVFDPFFTTKFTGRGLGMAAVLGIVRSHKGTIKCYSEPGRGSTFKVLFPAADLPAVEITEKAPPASGWTGSGTALVVDDEEVIRTVATQILEKCGFRVLTANDGSQGLDIFREHADEVTLVLLDMTMPKLNGEATFRELRRIRKDVKVILSSGYNEQEATSHFVGKGLAGFIQKPYRVDDLIRVVREVLDE